MVMNQFIDIILRNKNAPHEFKIMLINFAVLFYGKFEMVFRDTIKVNNTKQKPLLLRIEIIRSGMTKTVVK